MSMQFTDWLDRWQPNEYTLFRHRMRGIQFVGPDIMRRWDKATALNNIDLSDPIIPEFKLALIKEGILTAARADEVFAPESGAAPPIADGVSGTVPEAPIDGSLYARQNAGWTPFEPGGEVGPAGPQGPVGPEGPVGATGPQGSPGADSVVPGPQGSKGDKGDKGDTGSQGPVGPTGSQGLTGLQGPEGVPGSTGPAGQSGAPGPQGNPGASGPIGPTGATGPAGPIGPAGAQWPAGADSTVPGPTGPKGDKGDTGATGAQGPTGPASTVPGPTGPKGDKGDTGNTGPAGAASTVPGPTGPQGLTGAQGPKGDTGAQGTAGATGAPGATGAQGPAGPTGPAGVINATAPLNLSAGTISIDLSSAAPLASPSFTGDPRAPTPTAGDNDTSIATTAFVKSAIAAAAPASIDPATKTTVNPRRMVDGAFALSNGNLTITKTYANEAWYAAACHAEGRPGLKYFEAQVFGPSAASHIIGAGYAHGTWETGNQYPGNGTGSMGFGNGYWYTNAAGTGGFPTWVANDWLGLCFDTEMGGAGIRNITQNGTWNNVAGAMDPGILSQPGLLYTFACLTQVRLVPALALYYINTGFRLNFDGTFLGPVPTGAKRWGSGGI